MEIKPGFMDPLRMDGAVPPDELLTDDCGIRRVDDVCEIFDGIIPYGDGDGEYVLKFYIK